KTSTHGYCCIKTKTIATSDVPAGQDLLFKTPCRAGVAPILEREKIDAKRINEVKGGCAGVEQKNPFCA
ncbi:MAG TPA: hypothetical protein PKV86_00990, partial [Syntrophobacteraceae bacterium]|nr:hypothetical protein [Syntrophobacteraceae bacterium]